MPISILLRVVSLAPAFALCSCAPSPGTTDSGLPPADGGQAFESDGAMRGRDAGEPAQRDADAAGIARDAQSADEAAWWAGVWPVHVRVCSECHSGVDAVGLDLTRYSAWVSNRSVIRERVVARQDMPPYGARTLTPAERAAVASWLGP